MTDPAPIDPSEVRPGPIRHESLPPELLEQIRAAYEILGPYLNTTLEQFEIGFMRDMHPEEEIDIWCSIAAAWIDYHEKFLDDEIQSDGEEKKLLAALIAISAGASDVEQMGVPAEVGRRLLDCYDGLGEE